MTFPASDADDQLKRLADTAEDVGKTVTRRFEVSKSALRRAFWTSLIALLVGVAGIGVGVWGRLDAHNAAGKARDAASSLAAYISATNDARIGSCEQYNRQKRDDIAKDVALSHDTVQAIATAGGTRPISPAGQALVDAFNEKHDELIVEKNPLRDCSPAGIHRYLDGPPKSTNPKGTP